MENEIKNVCLKLYEDTYNDYVPKEFSNAVIVDGDLIKNEEFEVARSEIFRKANKAKLYPTK